MVQKRPDHLVHVKAAARMTCAALKHGATKAECDRAVQLRCRVGDPECDCERVQLLLRQLIQISASVAIAIAVVNALVVVVPILLRRVPLLGPILARIAAVTVLRRIANESNVIEGTFIRVRDMEAEIARSLLRRGTSGFTG